MKESSTLLEKYYEHRQFLQMLGFVTLKMIMKSKFKMRKYRMIPNKYRCHARNCLTLCYLLNKDLAQKRAKDIIVWAFNKKDSFIGFTSKLKVMMGHITFI